MENLSGPETNAKSGLPMREIQELAIGISAKNLNPTLLSEDFLKSSGIIPMDWDLARQPVFSPNLSQVTFKNGVSIAAQPRTVTFVQSIGAQSLDELKVPDLASQYVQKLPNAEYQTLSVSPKSLIPFPGSPDEARKYLTSTFLAPGPWQEFGKAPLQAGINLLYQLDRCQFSLNVNEAKIELPDRTAISGLLFAGNFNYRIAANSPQEQLAQLDSALGSWRSDLASFQEIVKERFLGQSESLFPAT